MDKNFPTNNGILVSLMVLVFFVAIQFASAQTDYRNFNSYDSKDFSVLYPHSWHIWNSTGTYSQPGTTQITIGKETPGNFSISFANISNTINIVDFPTKIEMTVISFRVTGFQSDDVLTSWIEKSYSPQSQRQYGIYAVQDIPTTISDMSAHKITYNKDYLCNGSRIPTQNMIIYVYGQTSGKTYIISLIHPASKTNFGSEIESIIKSVEIKDVVDLAENQVYINELLAKNPSLMTQGDNNLIEAYARQLQEDYNAMLTGINMSQLEIEKADKYNTSLSDIKGESYLRITNTPIPASGNYMSLPYIASPPRC